MGLGRGMEASGCSVTGMHKATPTCALHTRTHRVTLTLSHFHTLPYAHRCTPTPVFSRDGERGQPDGATKCLTPGEITVPN